MKDEALTETLDPETLTSAELSAAVVPEEQEVSQPQTEEPNNREEAARHWVDEMFSREQERLKRQGILTAKQWVELLAGIDKSLTERPIETLTFLSQAYGISLPVKSQDQTVRPEIIQCLRNLEQNQKNLWQALAAASQQTKQLTISNFANAKDDEGHLLHPHFNQVKEEMFALIESGVVADYESAYEKALWLNQQTREELLEKQETDKLQTLAEEADKAKSAGFSPKGGQEKEDFSQMTTREILEHTFKKLEG